MLRLGVPAVCRGRVWARLCRTEHLRRVKRRELETESTFIKVTVAKGVELVPAERAARGAERDVGQRRRRRGAGTAG